MNLFLTRWHEVVHRFYLREFNRLQIDRISLTTVGRRLGFSGEKVLIDSSFGGPTSTVRLGRRGGLTTYHRRRPPGSRYPIFRSTKVSYQGLSGHSPASCDLPLIGQSGRSGFEPAATAVGSLPVIGRESWPIGSSLIRWPAVPNTLLPVKSSEVQSRVAKYSSHSARLPTGKSSALNETARAVEGGYPTSDGCLPCRVLGKVRSTPLGWACICSLPKARSELSVYTQKKGAKRSSSRLQVRQSL